MSDSQLVPEWAVAELSSGNSSSRLAALLRSSQLSLRTLQLATVARALTEPTEPTQPEQQDQPGQHGQQTDTEQAEIADAVAALRQLSRRAPNSYAEIALAPEVGMWLGYRLPEIHRDGADWRGAVSTGHELAALAAATALRAGQDLQVTVAIRGGRIYLPTLGALPVPGVDRSGRIALRTRPELQLAPVGTADNSSRWQARTGWRRPRQLSARAGDLPIRIALDDCSPYRTVYGTEVEDQLDDVMAGEWARHFADAWELIVRLARPDAELMASGLLTSVVPLRPAADTRSTTVRDVVGGLSSTPPASGEELALNVVHEFQHSKLWALMRLLDLSEPEADRLRIRVPWRKDARPPQGVLQGAFAFLGVAEFQIRLAAIRRDRPAMHQAAALGQQVAAAVDELEASGALTLAGFQVVTAIRRRLGTLSTT